MKLLLVGQAPSRSAGARRAFDGRSGERLACCLEMTLTEMLSIVDTVNVFSAWPGKHGGRYAYREKGDRFPITDARRRASLLDRCPLFRNRPVVVFASARTAQAFGYLYPIFTWFDRPDPWCLDHGRPSLGLIIPHPSGCNLLWNDPSIRDQVARSLGDAIKIAAARLPRTKGSYP